MDIVDGLWIRLISSEYNQNLLQKHFPILYPMFNTVCRDKNKLQIASFVANVLANKLDGWFEECFLFELSPEFRKNETRSEMLFLIMIKLKLILLLSKIKKTSSFRTGCNNQYKL
jgi:hypothetical protein